MLIYTIVHGCTTQVAKLQIYWTAVIFLLYQSIRKWYDMMNIFSCLLISGFSNSWNWNSYYTVDHHNLITAVSCSINHRSKYFVGRQFIKHRIHGQFYLGYWCTFLVIAILSLLSFVELKVIIQILIKFSESLFVTLNYVPIWNIMSINTICSSH